MRPYDIPGSLPPPDGLPGEGRGDRPGGPGLGGGLDGGGRHPGGGAGGGFHRQREPGRHVRLGPVVRHLGHRRGGGPGDGAGPAGGDLRRPVLSAHRGVQVRSQGPGGADGLGGSGAEDLRLRRHRAGPVRGAGVQRHPHPQRGGGQPLLPRRGGAGGERHHLHHALGTNYAMSVELMCRDAFEGDPRELLAGFLSGIHYNDKEEQ